MKASTASNQLILSARTGDQELSKAALKFNRLLSKLDRVQEKKEILRNELDTKLADTLREVLPVFQEWCNVRVQIITGLIHYLLEYSVSSRDEEVLLDYLEGQIQELMHVPIELKQEIKAEMLHAWAMLTTGEAWEESEPSKTEEPMDEEAFRTEQRKRELDYLNEQLRPFGKRIEASDVGENLSDEEWHIKLKEKIDALNSEIFGQKKEKKKTKKQTEREQKKAKIDEVKAKSFSALYKQLAKMLHPDGETNEQMREKKTEWMKKLTHAYKSKDIKTLLLLELEWLRTEKSEAQRLSEEKLEFMNEMLSEQVKEAERQAEMVLYEPRYRLLAAFAGGRENLLRYHPKNEKRVLSGYLSSDTDVFRQLQTSQKDAKRVVKEVIQDARRMSNPYY